MFGRAFAVLAVVGTCAVLTAPAAHSQLLPPPLPPLPPVTTPPIDVVVPGLGIEVHVPGQDPLGSGGPTLPGRPPRPRPGMRCPGSHLGERRAPRRRPQRLLAPTRVGPPGWRPAGP